MNTLTETLTSARHEAGKIIISLQSGVCITFPIKDNKRLENASHEQLNNIEVSPFGLHWPDIDEDLSLRGIIDGDYGQHI
ncbi:MAG: DUF2442 domain-containing protein [Rubritalea sp.]|jgi:hypothetical protein|tara:strand:- start:714 stop:953 length:240 start_codon:yes stop_codon:yes gene_type:complete